MKNKKWIVVVIIAVIVLACVAAAVGLYIGVETGIIPNPHGSIQALTAVC